MRQFLLDMIGGAFWAGTWLVWALIAASAWGQDKPDPLIGRPFDSHPTGVKRAPGMATLKWSKRELTWQILDDGSAIFGNASSIIASFAVYGAWRDGITRSFDQWSSASGLRFRMTKPPDTADIKIGGYAFKEPTPVLAFAQFPPPAGFECEDCGDVCFNLASPFWALGSIEGVALHELGHSLGLEHGPGVMGPTYTGLKTLTRDDKDRIRGLYPELAPPPETPPPTDPPADPTPTPGARPFYDFDGDRIPDVWNVDPRRLVWTISRSRLGPQKLQFGAQGDLPVPADYDGDGLTDLALFRPSSAEWFLARSRSGAGRWQFGGVLIDHPAPGDWDGDGVIDLGVYRPSVREILWFSPATNKSGTRPLP
jgi:hypothetical protein